MRISPDHGHKNTLHVSCRSERGPPAFSMELLLGDRKLGERAVQRGQFANFTITVIPGTVRLQCRARSPDQQEAASHAQMKINPDDLPSGRAEDKEEREPDAGLQFLIPLASILTSVSSEVQNTNHIILAVCGSALLMLLLFIIFITYLRNRREDKADA